MGSKPGVLNGFLNEKKDMGSTHHVVGDNIFTKFHQNPITHCKVMERTLFNCDIDL